MGLAASQARFLNLTARKTNLEYEGQQINQQRTTLSNQSASYYNSMLTLTVPTPPSTDTFKKIVYTVSDGASTYNLYQITKNSTNTYTISYTSQYTQNELAATAKAYSITSNSDTEHPYKAGNKNLSVITNTTLKEDAINDVIADLKTQKSELASQISKTTVYAMNIGTDSNPNYVYFVKSELESHKDKTETLNGSSYQDVTHNESGSIQNATVNRDKNNRLVSIQADGFAGGQEVPVTATSITDEDAYTDAYNEYQYQTYLYQQRMEEINAQTSIIQAKDKKLELRLKQLDTEENAIKTEMDSINSVLKDNIDKSFKTFA